MNEYFKNLNKIEFVITNACTGRCKHCSEGEHAPCGAYIDPIVAADAVGKVAQLYDIKTVMTFGGEPLLYPCAVYEIIKRARELDVPRRQLITNGYFSKDTSVIRNVAKRLYEVGVNDLLISVDAFHQESIPIDIVRRFADEARSFGIPIRLQPAWLVSVSDYNPYNQRTRELLCSFENEGYVVGDGNIIFCEGNAKKYLSEYFLDSIPENPYVEDPTDIRCLSFSPDGEVLGRNVYEYDILDIMEKYTP